MPIWKCAMGGYHSGKDCYEEFGKLMKHTDQQRDVQLVRIPDRDELVKILRENFAQQFMDEDIDAVLWAMVELTPDGKDKKSWDKIHRRKK